MWMRCLTFNLDNRPPPNVSTILQRLPITQSATSISFPLGIMTVKPDQIIVWVALTTPDYPHVPEVNWRFPAVLDTGSGYPFLMHRDQFDRWVTGNQIQLPRLSSEASLAVPPCAFGLMCGFSETCRIPSTTCSWKRRPIVASRKI